MHPIQQILERNSWKCEPNLSNELRVKIDFDTDGANMTQEIAWAIVDACKEGDYKTAEALAEGLRPIPYKDYYVTFPWVSYTKPEEER